VREVYEGAVESGEHFFVLITIEQWSNLNSQRLLFASIRV
jgi:hypothetical protein